MSIHYLVVGMSGYLQYCRLVAVDSLSIEWGVEYHREHIQVRLSVTSTFVVADTVLMRLKQFFAWLTTDL